MNRSRLALPILLASPSLLAAPPEKPKKVYAMLPAKRAFDHRWKVAAWQENSFLDSGVRKGILHEEYNNEIYDESPSAEKRLQTHYVELRTFITGGLRGTDAMGCFDTDVGYGFYDEYKKD